jgi:hypothetical protein
MIAATADELPHNHSNNFDTLIDGRVGLSAEETNELSAQQHTIEHALVCS